MSKADTCKTLAKQLRIAQYPSLCTMENQLFSTDHRAADYDLLPLVGDMLTYKDGLRRIAYADDPLHAQWQARTEGDESAQSTTFSQWVPPEKLRESLQYAHDLPEQLEKGFAPQGAVYQHAQRLRTHAARIETCSDARQGSADYYKKDYLVAHCHAAALRVLAERLDSIGNTLNIARMPGLPD